MGGQGVGGGWGVGCCKKSVGEWDRQVRITKEGLLVKAAIDLTAGFLFAKDRDFNYSACCVLAHSSEAKVGAQGSLQGTNLPLIPSLFPRCKTLLQASLFPSFLELGSWLLGFSAFSATDTSLSTSNLQKRWFELLISKFLNTDTALAFFDISPKGE